MYTMRRTECSSVGGVSRCGARPLGLEPAVLHLSLLLAIALAVSPRNLSKKNIHNK
uniref:Uncharacterized protein n=1 Tax=Arundo donax TaxID=35708 RepID=A0A0A9EHK8_ARUDO